MIEQFETLQKVNIALGLIPVFVMVGVTRLLARHRKHEEDTAKNTKDIAVLQAKREGDRLEIERLQDFRNHMSERRD